MNKRELKEMILGLIEEAKELTPKQKTKAALKVFEDAMSAANIDFYKNGWPTLKKRGKKITIEAGEYLTEAKVKLKKFIINSIKKIPT